ncbi:MAG: hypothetical protein EX341_16880 [Candidatus Scalindua sp. SCAELEC01]|nr:MAG: hypothetical protein EX341_16880 [Candidatus Scalindua sp. SCAELEC01]
MFERKLPIYYVAATISKSSSTIVRSGYDIVTRLVPGHFSFKHRVFVQTLTTRNKYPAMDDGDFPPTVGSDLTPRQTKRKLKPITKNLQ